MTREQILDTAKGIICGDRDQQYGSPEDSFKTIAQFWSAYLDYEVKPSDVASMMVLLKIARIGRGKSKDDNWIDIAGYAACGGEINDPDD